MPTYNMDDNLVPADFTIYNGTVTAATGKLRATSVGSSPQCSVLAPSSPDGEFFAIVNGEGASVSTIGVICRGSNTDNYIHANINMSNGILKLYRRESGTFNELASYTVPAFSNTGSNSMALVANGDQITVKWKGSVVIGPIQETFNQTATLAGIRLTDTVHTADSITIPEAGANPILIGLTSPVIESSITAIPKEVTVPVSWGTIPTTVQYNLNDAGWVTGIASPSGLSGSFPVTFPVGMNTIKVRRSEGAQDESETINVLIAERVILAAGQSNISGASPLNIAYVAGATSSAYLYGNDDVLKIMENPWDSNIGQIDAISADAGLRGAWMTEFANIWSATKDTPIVIIPVCKSGTGSWEWQKTSTTRVAGLNLYESALRRANKVGSVTDVFYQQAERNANDVYLTTPLSYKTDLKQFASDIFSDLGVNTYVIPLHTLTSGAYDGDGVTTGQIPIRAAQLQAQDESPYITVGPPITDIDISVGGTDDDGNNDGVHFMTIAAMTTVATRTFAGFLNERPTANAGPDQSNIAAGATVTLDFSGSTDSDGTIVSYNVTQTAGTTVTLSGSGATRTFTAPTTASAQTLTFSLVVTDDDGADSAPDTVGIGVLAEAIPDTTPPVITLNGSSTINLTVGDTYTELGATATDNIDGSVAVVITGTVNTAIASTYTRFYNAEDAAGNNAIQVARSVIVSAIGPEPNNLPTVTITAPTTSTVGATVTLTANPLPLSGTFTYSWRVIAGGVTLSSTTAQTVTYTAPVSTTTVTIGVVANDGTTDSQEYFWSVNPKQGLLRPILRATLNNLVG